MLRMLNTIDLASQVVGSHINNKHSERAVINRGPILYNLHTDGLSTQQLSSRICCHIA